MRDKLLQTARDKFDEIDDLTRDWRKMAEEDIRFAAGDHWPAELKARREQDLLPCLTIDRLEGPISQLVGDQRMNDLAVKVIPKSLDSKEFRGADGKPIEEREFVTGLVRDIQRRSRFEWIQAQAFEHSVICGLGGWYMDAAYVDAMSFDQRILIRRIDSPLAIYPDIKGWRTENGQQDCFIVEDQSAQTFKRLYPKASTSWDAGDEWGNENVVRTAVWWTVEKEADKLLLLRHPDKTTSTILESDLNGIVGGQLPSGVNVIRERDTYIPTVMRRVITSNEVLDETAWPGKRIPVALCIGKELWHKGKLDLHGIVRKGRDPQRLYNYNRSAVAEMMGAAPKAPYLVTPDQINGLQEMWATANVGKKPYLLYNPDPRAPGAPQRTQIVYPTGFAQEAIVASADIMAVTKIHEASLGQRSNETSGVAIQSRQREGDTGNYFFTDNLLLAVEETGRILVDAIPQVYDSTRVVTSRAQDGAVTSVEINKPTPAGPVNRFSGGYDTEVTAGPAFGTARQEAVQAMTALGQAAPQLMAAAADVWVGNMDWPGADELAKRFKRLVPPELLDDKDGPDQAAMVQQMQAALQEMQARMVQTQEAAQAAAEELVKAQQNAQATEFELQSLKIKLDAANAEMRLAKAKASQQIEFLQNELKTQDAYQRARDAIREGQERPAEEAKVDLQPVLQAISGLAGSMQKEPAPAPQPVQVVVGAGNKVRKGKAVRNPDGSWSMVATEEEVQE
jgi:hypothetical protein